MYFMLHAAFYENFVILMKILYYRFSQAILDVVVIAGPNSGGPVFAQDRYDAQVSEGAAVKSTIITLSVRI